MLQQESTVIKWRSHVETYKNAAMGQNLPDVTSIGPRLAHYDISKQWGLKKKSKTFYRQLYQMHFINFFIW